MNNKDFKKLVKEGLAELPDRIREKMENVALVIEDEPTSEQQRKLKQRGKQQELLFGLYEGVPLSQRGAGYTSLPDKITIFKNDIEDSFEEKQIKDKVKEIVWHEVAHHFGFDEAEVRKLEKEKF